MYIETPQQVNNMVAFSQNVIIKTVAARAGETMYSESGFIVGKRETSEVPLVGTIVSVGEDVPEADFAYLKPGTVVLLPTGRISHVPSPEYLRGEVQRNKQDQYVVARYDAIQVVY